MIDSSIPGSDGWWLSRLSTQLGKSFPRLGQMRSYVDGDIPVFDAGPSAQFVQDAYRRFVEISRLNVAELIVDAVTSRMVPTGFRSAQTGDSKGDSAAQERWINNHMAVQARDIFDDMATYGQGFAHVTTTGIITYLDPWMAACDTTPAAPWEAEAAIVTAWDPINSADEMTVYWHQAGEVMMRIASRPGKTSSIPTDGKAWTPGKAWNWKTDAQRLGLSRVPVIPFTARKGRGQFESHTDSLDRINHTIFQRLIITVMQAYRQRWISGDLPDYYPDDHPQAGQPIPYDEIFQSGPLAIWRLPKDAEIQESSITDITPLLAAVKDELRQLASVSKTPLYILDAAAAQGSAEGASASRETLVFKVEDMCARAGDALASAMALSFEATGDPRQGLEVIWQPADRVSMMERGQAASQAATSLPRRTIWRKIWQLTPDEITQAEQDLADERFEAMEAENGPKPKTHQ